MREGPWPEHELARWLKRTRLEAKWSSRSKSSRAGGGGAETIGGNTAGRRGGKGASN